MTVDENAHLPPKGCTIDKLVTIPEDVNKVLESEKRATRRNDRYADIGEVMVLDGQRFVVHNVYQQKLGDMTNEDAINEGYENLEQYQKAILAIHPGMKWAPQLNVWVHEYRPELE